MQYSNQAGPFHIIGIGGIGMSAIAEIMLADGFEVQGSDLKANANVERLRRKGIKILIGHDASHLAGATHIIVSTAIKPGNPEYDAACARGLPILNRAEILADLMRQRSTISITGTHGKTTTTSLVASLLEGGGLDPTVINGGIMTAWGSNARVGAGQWMVVEADESDGTFVQLPTTIGIVTNIDPEHMDFFGTPEKLHQDFTRFFRQIPADGLALACIDHPVVKRIIDQVAGQLSCQKLWTYGVSEVADLCLKNTRKRESSFCFDVDISEHVAGGKRLLEGLTFSLPGDYNALNAVAAIGVALELGIDDQTISRTLQSFQGVKRRFTPAGSWNGAHIYDDYAHHPVEITAALKAARTVAEGRVIAIMQPHRYSRLKNLFDDFSKSFDAADIVIVMPVFAAGEPPLEGVDHIALSEAILAREVSSVYLADDERSLASVIAGHAQKGDVIVGLGAGSISAWILKLAETLADHSLNMEMIG